MSYTMDSIFVNAYNAMLHHLSEQRGSKLKGLFQEEQAKGEKHFFDRVGAFSVSEINSLASPVLLQDSSMSRRMATLKAYDAATLIHDVEKMKMLVDPTNDYVVKMMNAHGKNYDLALINALIVESNDVDMDSNNVYLLVNARGREDLLADSNFTSHDFQNVKALAGRELPSFRGIQLVHTERLPAHTAGSVYRAILCTDNALKVAKGMDPVVDISQRKDIQDLPFQIYTKQAFGAVRMEEGLVVDILFQ